MRLDVYAQRMREARTDEDRADAASVERVARAAADRYRGRGQDYARAAFYGALWGAVFSIAERRAEDA